MAGSDHDADEPLARTARPQSLIITTYGAYSRPIGGWFSVSSLLTLLGEVGIDDPSVRSALSRFKRRGVLTGERRDGVAGYALGESARRTFDIGDSRVLERRFPPPNRGWVLAAFSIPESARDVRYRLRSRLARIGFAQVGGGLWIAPRQLESDVQYIVELLDIRDHVDLFLAEHSGFRATREAIGQWWNLEEIGAAYEEFTAEYAPLASSWARTRVTPDLVRAFSDYTRALTSWRPLPYIDPGLPREYLPKAWAGDKATETFFALHDRLARPSMQFVEEVASR
jgi:phenylacetic acid degradation operon negative regulatory protein